MMRTVRDPRAVAAVERRPAVALRLELGCGPEQTRSGYTAGHPTNHPPTCRRCACAFRAPARFPATPAAAPMLAH